MKLYVCKKYNRPDHSYLLTLRLEADDMDPNVFVVKDQPFHSIGGSSSYAGSSDNPFESSQVPIPTLSSAPASSAAPGSSSSLSEGPPPLVVSAAQLLELKELIKIGAEYTSLYTEYTWTAGDIVAIEKWTDYTKTRKLFTKILDWTSGNCDQTITLDETTGVTLTVDYTYDVDDNVITSTEVLT